MICHNLRWQNEGRVNCMGRLILKIIALPVCLLLYLLGGIYDVGLRVYSLGAGIVYLLLFACVLLATVSGQWLSAGILVGIVFGLIVLTIGVGVIGAVIEVWKDKIKFFLMA